jgi:hypothetical protein
MALSAPRMTIFSNKKYASWPGLTWEAVNKHFPESEETLKGHGQKKMEWSEMCSIIP